MLGEFVRPLLGKSPTIGIDASCLIILKDLVNSFQWLRKRGYLLSVYNNSSLSLIDELPVSE